MSQRHKLKFLTSPAETIPYDFNTICSILTSLNVCSISFPLNPSSKVIGGSFVSLLSLLKYVITDLQYDRTLFEVYEAMAAL